MTRHRIACLTLMCLFGALLTAACIDQLAHVAADTNQAVRP